MLIGYNKFYAARYPKKDYYRWGSPYHLQRIEQNSSPDSRNILRTATGEGSQCVARYRPESHGEIFCLSPSTGAFAYGYDGAS